MYYIIEHQNTGVFTGTYYDGTVKKYRFKRLLRNQARRYNTLGGASRIRDAVTHSYVVKWDGTRFVKLS